VCGHVVCKTCVDAIVRPQGRCCVCEAKLEEGEKGLIPLGKEGALLCVAIRCDARPAPWTAVLAATAILRGW
jgi:nitric oxide synthase-interacting protein